MQWISEKIRDSGHTSLLSDILNTVETAFLTGKIDDQERPIVEFVYAIMDYIALFFEGKLSPSLLSETDLGVDYSNEGVEKMISSTFSQRLFFLFRL